MNDSLKLFYNEAIEEALVPVHNEYVRHYNDPAHQIRNTYKNHILEYSRLWSNTYNSEIVFHKTTRSKLYVKFNSIEDKVAFMLRWS
jgi:hypothetical protein